MIRGALLRSGSVSCSSGGISRESGSTPFRSIRNLTLFYSNFRSTMCCSGDSFTACRISLVGSVSCNLGGVSRCIGSASYTFRQRLGVALFERVLTIAVQACIEAGLVRNELIHFDLTAVVANGHRWSPYERAVILSKALLRYLEQVWAEQMPAEPLPEALRILSEEVALESLPHKGLQNVAPARVAQSVADWDEQTNPEQTAWQTTLEEAVQAELVSTDEPVVQHMTAQAIVPSLSRVAKRILDRLSHTRGDQNARVGRTTSYTWFCGYLLGFVVDGWHHVITAVVWAAGNVKQASLFGPALTQHLQRVPGKPKGAALDSAFDHPDVYACLDEAGIEGHITSREHAKPRDGGFGTDCLVWHASKWELYCPNEMPLQPQGDGRSGRQVFVGTGCEQCPLYAQCCPSGEGTPKTFALDPAHHRRWLQSREHCQTDAYKVAQQARFVEEGRFGLANLWIALLPLPGEARVWLVDIHAGRESLCPYKSLERYQMTL